MKNLFNLWPLVFCVVASVNLTRAETHVLDVGGTPIRLPEPIGFFRCDGKTNEFDQLQRSFIPASNRLLAAFGSEDDLAQILTGALPALERNFTAQSSNSYDSDNISSSGFNQLKKGMRSQLDEGREKMRDVLASIENSGSSSISTAVDSSTIFKFGDMVMLGVFDETPDSICFSTLIKGRIEAPKLGKPAEWVSIAAGCTLHVRNKIIYLYCTSKYRGKGDIEWARSNLAKWRDSVLAANQRTVSGSMSVDPVSGLKGQRSSFLDRRINEGIAGLAIGVVCAVVALLVNAFKKR